MAEAFAKSDSLPFISHYVQRRRKKRKSSNLPVSAQRYFTDLTAAGGQYYSLSNPITLSGDYEIESLVYFSGSDITIQGNSGNFNNRGIIFSNGDISLRCGGGETIFAGASTAAPNMLHIVKFQRIGSTGYIELNGVQVASGNVGTADTVIDTFGNNGGAYSNGIIANVKITDGSTLVGDFPLDENWTNGNVAVNRAAVLGSEDFVPSRVSGGWVDNNDGSYTKSSAVFGDLGEYYTDDSSVLAGGTYLITFTNTGADTINIFTRDGGTNIAVLTDLPVGLNTIIATAGDGGGLWFAKTSYIGTISDVSFKQIPSTTPYATAENITDADATERRRDNSFSPNRWVNVDDPNDYIEIAGT